MFCPCGARGADFVKKDFPGVGFSNEKFSGPAISPGEGGERLQSKRSTVSEKQSRKQ